MVWNWFLIYGFRQEEILKIQPFPVHSKLQQAHQFFSAFPEVRQQVLSWWGFHRRGIDVWWSAHWWHWFQEGVVLSKWCTFRVGGFAEKIEQWWVHWISFITYLILLWTSFYNSQFWLIIYQNVIVVIISFLTYNILQICDWYLYAPSNSCLLLGSTSFVESLGSQNLINSHYDSLKIISRLVSPSL